jgi:hypothetical protein
MADLTYVEQTDAKFSLQLTKFAGRLPTYSGILGVTTAEKNSATADAVFFAYTINWLGVNRDFSKASTSYKDLARVAVGAEVLPAVPPTPVADTPPALVEAGIQKRFTDLAERIKKSPNYTPTIGDALGITKSASTFVPGDGKPVLKLKLVEGGFPQISYKKGKYQSLMIQKDNGSVFELLTISVPAKYVDKANMPAQGETKKETYRAIYMYKGEVVGEWSDPVSINVTGQ